MKTQANMTKLVIGILLIAGGMGLAFLVWNVLVGMDVVYLSSRMRGISQLVPLLTSLPGMFVFTGWFMGRKNYVETSQNLDNNAFKFAFFLVLAILLDMALGGVGLVLAGLKSIAATVVAYGITLALQVVACLLAFRLCPPYSR